MGQWIDVVGAARCDRSPDRARWVASYKSGRYTVERPLQLGAALAGRPDLFALFSAVGRPLGEAFQLRDDVLGVVGDPSRTGKPVGDDLRDGKPTLLLALATERAGAAERRLLERAGADDLADGELAAMQSAIVGCGAVDAVETEIATLVELAVDALDRCTLEPPAHDALLRLCRLAAWRER
jgi:geranylgeranyl diphosphate synthase type I